MKESLPLTLGFLLCWLTNINSSSRSLIICSPGRTNKAEQQNIISSSLTLLIFGSGLTNHGISAQQKALTVRRKSAFIMNLPEIDKKNVAMMIWNTEKENDAHVYLGKLQNIHGKYVFINEEKDWTVSLDDEQLSRLQLVSDDLKGILLNADYALSMSMGDLPETDYKMDYQKTGINWSNNV